MELIDREDVKQIINGLSPVPPWAKRVVCHDIDKLPTIEAVPVVHCKDCEHWGMGIAGETEHIKCCEYGKYMVGENGYCVYGNKVQE